MKLSLCRGLTAWMPMDDTVVWLRIVNGKPSGNNSGGFMNHNKRENTFRLVSMSD